MLYVATLHLTLDMPKIRDEKIPVAERYKYPAVRVDIEEVFTTYIPTTLVSRAVEMQFLAIRRIEEFMQIVPSEPRHRELTDGDFLLLGPTRSRDNYDDFVGHRWFKVINHRLIPVDPTTERIDF